MHLSRNSSHNSGTNISIVFFFLFFFFFIYILSYYHMVFNIALHLVLEKSNVFLFSDGKYFEVV